MKRLDAMSLSVLCPLIIDDHCMGSVSSCLQLKKNISVFLEEGELLQTKMSGGHVIQRGHTFIMLHIVWSSLVFTKEG